MKVILCVRDAHRERESTYVYMCIRRVNLCVRQCVYGERLCM